LCHRCTVFVILTTSFAFAFPLAFSTTTRPFTAFPAFSSFSTRFFGFF